MHGTQASDSCTIYESPVYTTNVCGTARLILVPYHLFIARHSHVYTTKVCQIAGLKNEPKVHFQRLIFPRENLNMAAFNQAHKLKLLLLWFLRRREKRANKILEKKTLLRSDAYSTNKLRITFLKAILVCVNRPRYRALWMHPRSLTWFEMVDQEYDDELWYSNFRVTRGTFEFLLNKVMEYIRCKDTCSHAFCNFGEATAGHYIILLGIHC